MQPMAIERLTGGVWQSWNEWSSKEEDRGCASVGSRGSLHRAVISVMPVMLAPAGAWHASGKDWYVERSSQSSQDEGRLV